MDIQILKENLHKASALVARFSASKAQLPILSQVMIEARKEGVFFWATDLEVGVRIRVGGKVLDPGEIAVPAKLLSELSASLPLGAVQVSVKSSMLRVQAGPVQAELQSMNTSDFPRFGEGNSLVPLAVVSLPQLQSLVDRVGFALSSDESRPVLTGVLWEMTKGVAVATDGYRLSLMKDALPTVQGERERLIVSGGLLRETVRAMSEAGEKEVRLAFDEAQQQIVIMGTDILLMGRVLGGDYPHYQAILPESPETLIVFDREELLRGMRTASIFARESAYIVKMTLRDGVAVLSANAPQMGSNLIDVQVEMRRPGSGTIAFNAKYVLDVLSHMESNKVVFGMTGPLKPGLWMEEGNEQFTHVIMPVRVRGEGE